MANKEMSASEALFGFAGWLTTRPEKTVMSSVDDAAPIADLVQEFCNVNGLAAPREGWDKKLKHPPGQEQVRVALNPAAAWPFPTGSKPAN